jgi:quaternary ammonium compound-resistance protein SugE
MLCAAGVAEVGMALSLKFSAGWSRPWPGAVGVLLALASIVMLTFAIRDLPTGTAYVVWTGIGGVGTALAGILLFGESAAWPRLACMGVVVAGMAGLKWLEA